MKSTCAIVCLLALAALAPASANPIQKVISMIGDLEAKTIAEGSAAQKTYDEFAEFCEERSKELSFEIKTGKAEAEDLEATIAKASADIETFSTKIDELASSVATAEADLKAATEIRAKESADFAAEEKDLTATIDTLVRATTIIEREMAGGASMMQLKNAQTMEQALSVMVQASALSAADTTRLSALVQSSSSNDDSDEELGAPAAAVHENQSGGIVAVLQGLTEKAETQLDEARKAESKSLNGFQMLSQSLNDEIKFGNKDMDKTKKDLAEAEETKGTASGDLEVTNKALAEDTKALSEVHHDCMEKANTFETETTARGEELKALATAKKVIQEATAGAESQSYSFLQVSESSTGFTAVRLVRSLAKKQHSTALAQLAARMASAVRYGAAAGANPFDKIKGLIQDMIEKLSEEAEADAKKQGYCKKEIGETEAKRADKEAEIEKLSTKIDQQTAHSAKLKENVAVLQKELAALAKTQATMDSVRAEEKAEFTTNSAEMEQGVEGIKLALKTLRDYYAKGDSTASGDAGGGIISMLEVVESDFTKGLQEMTATEMMAAKTYEEETKENAIEKATKDQDVKYKGKEAKGLDEAVAEGSSDRSGVQSELDAVLEYEEKIHAQCDEKVEPYEEKKKRREDEIAGLKDALEILESEAALIQKSSKHTLRGARVHRA